MLELWQTVFPFLPFYFVAVFVVVVMLLLENKNPVKTSSYLLLILLLPVLGIIIYLIFGQNLRKRKIFSKRQLINTAFGQQYVDEYLDDGLKANLPDIPDVQYYTKLVRFLNKDLSPLTHCNQVSILKNGNEKLTRLTQAIAAAESHIHIEYYIFSDDDFGGPLTDLLIEKAKTGIEVRMILDAVGSFSLNRSYYRKLRDAGIEVHEFMPVLFPSFTSKINYRDHRKIVIIDGNIGFTGGINIDDRYVNNGKHKTYWRDTHLLIEGDAVKTLQLLFVLNWQFVCEENWLPEKKHFPDCKQKENHFVQVNASGPDWELASIMDSFFLAIVAARESIKIATPYFIPNESILNAIITAAKSGIAVELMVPHRSDSWIVQAASLSFMRVLLEAGVRVFLYEKGFLHSKVMLVDGNFSIVGTANMDYRSFDLNYEVNTYLYSEALATELTLQFEEDKTECKELDLDRWRNRPLPRKLLTSACRILAPLL